MRCHRFSRLSCLYFRCRHLRYNSTRTGGCSFCRGLNLGKIIDFSQLHLNAKIFTSFSLFVLVFAVVSLDLLDFVSEAVVVLLLIKPFVPVVGCADALLSAGIWIDALSIEGWPTRSVGAFFVVDSGTLPVETDRKSWCWIAVVRAVPSDASARVLLA